MEIIKEKRKRNKMTKLSENEFFEICKKNHGDKYDYSKAEYKNLSNKITIICPIHGEFKQKPSKHLHQDCPQCGFKKIGDKKRKLVDKSVFIENANKIHNYFYDYKLIPEKINKANLLDIICPIHGQFQQIYKSHIKGYGCEKCGIISSSKVRTIFYTKQQFIEKANKIHQNNDYDYSLLNDLITAKDILKIICKKHGVFEKREQKFINAKSGCSKCKRIIKTSKQQLELTLFLGEIYQAEILINDRSVISPHEIDSYLVNIQLGFEFNGVYWHCFSNSNKDKMYHFNKTRKCIKKGIKLIHIFEDDWNNKRHIIKNHIRNLMFVNKNVTINASKCEIKEIDNQTKRRFLKENSLFRKHLKTNYNLGLFYQNQLIFVYCMNLNNNLCNLIEIAEKNDLNVLQSIQILRSYLFEKTDTNKIVHDLDLSLYLKFEDFLFSGFRKMKFKKPKMFYSQKFKIYNCGYMNFVLEKDIFIKGDLNNPYLSVLTTPKYNI